MESLIADILVITVLVLAVTGACIYLYKENKKGRSCMGCSMAGTCPHKDTGKCESGRKDA